MGEERFGVPHQSENYRRARTRGCFQEPPETGKAGAAPSIRPYNVAGQDRCSTGSLQFGLLLL